MWATTAPAVVKSRNANRPFNMTSGMKLLPITYEQVNGMRRQLRKITSTSTAPLRIAPKVVAIAVGPITHH